MQHPQQTRAQARSITSPASGFVSPLPTPISQKSVNLTRDSHTPCEPHKREPHNSSESHTVGLYRHNGGCGEPAFLFKKIPLPGDHVSLTTEIGLHVNGEPILGTDRVACDHCGEQLHLRYENVEVFA